MEKPHTVSSTFANRYKPTRRPKFAKELAKPTQRKIVCKKFPAPLKKIKNANTQADTDRQESKMTRIRKLNIDSDLQGQMKEHQAVIE